MSMRKHPASFKLEPPLKDINAAVNDVEVVLFEGLCSCIIWEYLGNAGSVRELCPMAPNNVNTMATGALAAHNLGFDKVKAKLIADPK